MNNLEIAAHLLALSKREIESININSGICAELSEVFDLSHYEISIIVGDIAENWSKFSGSRTFPVPHPMIDSARAFDTGSIWSADEYGNNRRDLCAFIAEELLKI